MYFEYFHENAACFCILCGNGGKNIPIRNVSAFAAYGHYLSQTRFDVEVSVVSEGTLHCAKEKTKYRTPRKRKIMTQYFRFYCV